MTYSILLADQGALGVAVQSYFPAVLPAVARLRAGLGAAVVQASGSGALADRLLDDLAGGASAADAVQLLVDTDEGSDARQIALLRADGEAAGFDGRRCLPVVASTLGHGIAVQGNCLASADVVEGMARAAHRPGPLRRRVLWALQAAELAGGEIRGQRSAGLLVVGADGSAESDLRVDDAPDAVDRLTRLCDLQDRYAVLADAAVVGDPERLAAELRTATSDPTTADLAVWLAVELATRHGEGVRARNLLAPLLRADARWSTLLARVARTRDLGALSPHGDDLARDGPV